MAGEKTEKATPKRRNDERKKGNVLQSKDIATVVSLITMFYFLQFMMPSILKTLKEAILYFANESAVRDNILLADLRQIFIRGLLAYGLTAVPLLLVAMGIGILGTGVQTRFLYSPSLLQFKASRLNPLSGISKMFSMRSAIELLKSLLKITALLYVIYSTVAPKVDEIPRLMEMSFQAGTVYVGQLIMSIVFNVSVAFVFIAILDFAYQWFDFEKNIRMSKQEIKEEYKQMEGDPQIKGKIRERQRAMAQRRMMQEVPKADVIIRNPTHYAIAIQYDDKKHRAPIVIAKGADLVAMKIIEIAKQHDIVTTENKPLARSLYESVELNQEIPEQFYQSIAEVLAFVYSIKKKGLKNSEKA